MGLIASPLDDILSSRAKVRLLRLFSTEPDPMSAREAARRVEMAKRSADLALRDLVQVGVIRRHGSGAQPTYVLNPHHALVRHAVLILFGGGKDATAQSGSGEQGAIHEFFDTLRSAVEVPNTQDVLWAALFGSTAKGEDTLESDIDLAVIVADEMALTRMQERLADMKPVFLRRFGRVLSPVVMTLAHGRALAASGHALIESLVDGRVIAGRQRDVSVLLRGAD